MASPIGTGNFRSSQVNTPVIGQLAVVPLLDETLQFAVERRSRRDSRQKLFEPEHVLRCIHNEFHAMTNQPDEFKLPLLDFIEAAKDAPVSIRLEVFSDYVQRTFCHLVSDCTTCNRVQPYPESPVRIVA